jgi:TRAP-type mannitol/chloroaromatic compound transport system permease small subunit
MTRLLRLAGAIDRVSLFFGWIAAVLVLLGCLISAGNASSRYLFSLSSNAWLEIQWQIFAGIFLLGAANVLRLNEHVRVDLLYGGRTVRGKLWTDVIGIVLFLVPSMLTMIYFSWSFFVSSFASGERSSNAGGLVLWPVKVLLPFGLFTLLLQGLAELIKRVAALRGDIEPTIRYEKPTQ